MEKSNGHLRLNIELLIFITFEQAVFILCYVTIFENPQWDEGEELTLLETSMRGTLRSFVKRHQIPIVRRQLGNPKIERGIAR